jgi:diguanylate cyclase (GGDEF)-like protein
MMEKEELYARIEELERELAEERIRRKITEDNSDCALWEYEIASKKYVLSRKLGGKWNTTNMVIENYQEQMHNWGFVHPDDWAAFDEFCAAMDRGDEHISYEVRQVSDESVFVWFRYVGIPVYDKDHKPYKIMGKTMDITEEKKNQELLEQKAERDSLTDLYNKAKMRKLVEKHIRRADAHDEGAFLIIDIDDFKSINDTYGHLYGDEVLIKIANILLISTGLEDYAGRIGGDEFCVFCRGENAGQHAMETAERISQMADRIQLSGRRVTLSMGISKYPADAATYEDLYQKADQALYRVKHSGKNAFSVYDKNYNYADYTSGRKGNERETKREDAGKKNIFIEREIFDYAFRMMSSEQNIKEAFKKIFFELGIRFQLQYFGLIRYENQKAEIYDEWSKRSEPIALDFYTGIWPELENCFKEHSFYMHHDGLMIPIYAENKLSMITLIQSSQEEHQWTEAECEILSTMTRMMESYLNREKFAEKGLEKEQENQELTIPGTETPESFSGKMGQILPWQDSQYAEVFLGIRDYDEISAKMSEEVKNSLLYHLGTHIQKHLKGQEMVCHVKKDEFLLLLDNHVEAASEKIGHIMIMFEAMIGDKYPDVSINLYSGIYYLESRGYRPEEIFRISKTLKNKAKRYCTVENSIYENRKSAGNVIDIEAGMLNRGNLTRLKNLLNRATKGERLTVGFIGGSITQGFAATEPDQCYAARTVAWLRKVFPNTEFDYVNAGIGATDSQFGAARVQEDLLQRLPDLVFVEFSVNDHSTPHFCETYEGLVRQIYGSASAPAMVLIHNVYYDTGKSAAYYHAQVGRHYDLPCISIQNSIYPAVAAGRLPAEKITADFLHPNDLGHELVASVITNFLEKVIHDKTQEPQEIFPAPLTENAYEHCMRLQYSNSTPGKSVFVEDMTPQRDITDIFRNGWSAGEKGAYLEFAFRGTGAAVQYRRVKDGPAPIATAVVDENPETACVLDGTFDETWGDKMQLTTVAEHLPYGEHRVRIELTETHENDKAGFYLVSLIVSGVRTETEAE